MVAGVCFPDMTVVKMPCRHLVFTLFSLVLYQSPKAGGGYIQGKGLYLTFSFRLTDE